MINRRTLLGLAAAAGFVKAPRARAAAADALKGKVHFRGESRYESFRQAATWNARKPNRFPEAIVLPQDEQDVVAAVRLAKQRGWQVTTRSGGHSWYGSHTCDKSVQINLARMQEIEVDRSAGIVKISPACVCPTAATSTTTHNNATSLMSRIRKKQKRDWK